MSLKLYGNEYRTTIVCVDSYADCVLEGRYYNQAREEGVRFVSAFDFLRSMENMLNQTQFPQAFAGIRSFQNSLAELCEKPEKSLSCYGGLATFHLKVLFRQNVSWQGTLRWIEGKKEESFRSVLELLFLMDSALRESKANL